MSRFFLARWMLALPLIGAIITPLSARAQEQKQAGGNAVAQPAASDVEAAPPQRGRGPGQGGPRFGGFGGVGGSGGGFAPRPFDRQPERVPDQPIDAGYLFIDGMYLAPPYKVRAVEDGVTVNGRPLACRPPEMEFGRGRFENPDPWRRLGVQVAMQLSAQSVVLAFSDQPLVVLDGSIGAYDLFQRLTGEGKSGSKVELVDRLPDGFDERVWNKWLTSFTPSLGLRARATSLISSFDATDDNARREVNGVKWLNKLAYPLTLAGMILTVLSVGHLLGGRPLAGKTANEQDFSLETQRALRYSLVLIALLSLLDLAWTIIAWQSNHMRELNPLGNHLIESPALLALFKIGVTGMSIGLLFALRKYRRAQVAAWWACLILTILAFRWLTLNSMMVSPA